MCIIYLTLYSIFVYIIHYTVTWKVASTRVATVPARKRLMASCRTWLFTWLDTRAGAGLLATSLIAAHTHTQMCQSL